MLNKKTIISPIQLIIVFCGFCFMSFSPSLSLAADVIITVGEGMGTLGSNNNTAEVSLENPNDKVRGIQMDVCDVDNYLSCTACETAERTSGFDCMIHEIGDGCCRVILVSTPDDGGDLIEKGTSTIFTLKYDVSGEASAGECRDLNAENVKVSDEFEDILDVEIYAGKFCFFMCGDIYPDESSPGGNDCGDGVVDIYDVLEAIDLTLGIDIDIRSDCQLTRADLPTGTLPSCRAPDGVIDIFDILVIIDIVLNRPDCCNYYYGVAECIGDEDCDDGNVCTDDTCDALSACVYTPVEDGTPCPDSDLCNGEETCQAGVCEAGTPLTCNDSEACTDDSCEPATGCIYTPVEDGTSCDDDKFCTETDICQAGVCEGSGDPCDDENDCTDDTCYEVDDSCSYICNASGPADPCCEDPVCADAPSCSFRVTLDPGDVWVEASGVGIKVPLCLSNPEDVVGGVQVDICDGDDYITCTECELTERTTLFDCQVNELEDGCCRVIIFSNSPTGLINPGECTIAKVVFEENYTLTECKALTLETLVVTDRYNYIIEAVGLSGSICPFICGDVWPADDPASPDWDCGDGAVGIFDIIEEVDFALGRRIPDGCQASRTDVPTGTPPYCDDPDGLINIQDVMVIIDMGLGRPNCCSYYYGGKIY